MTLTAFQTVALAALVVYFGRYIKSKIHVLDKYNLPSPVIGGFIVAVIISILKANGLFVLTFNKAFEEALMITFFTSVGYSASVRLLKEGGRAVVFFLLLTIGGLVAQIVAGIGLAKMMGEHPLMGVLTGAVSLTGGPGTALAFGPVFEAAGVEGASVIGLTTAMGGIVLGGLIGTPLATYLINKKKLKHPVDHNSGEPHESMILKSFAGRDLLMHLLALTLIMGIGTTISSWISTLQITLPIYIGSMVVAAIFRNIEDAKPVFKISPEWIEEIGSVALTLFIAMAIMSLRLEELKNAALPILVFLTVQAVLVAVTAVGPAFWVGGKDYEASVMSAGYVGFMMGTTANAMANMHSLSQRYGHAYKAFLVVPLVGSCFIDFINAALVTFCINMFGN
ncbi:sodium/glutamate symporter [Bdellovibrio bacteriovorus]|uniref:Sodium/glutamate symporter n=1 Tax=Bdellovibrio bacteriovorus str. Tiberius TaxID=1069642 RepID=K7YZR2_BDEBC|nr:sodium/glutamate symporter [Bdellovibrio bacteriovorus]AFY02220.1 sodium/glutamate symport carrier protein [Bdellovibrio bacteriovorus str. Tiberius]